MDRLAVPPAPPAEPALPLLSRFGRHVRIPLTSLLGMVDLLRATELSEEQAQCVEALAAAGTGLHRVIENFLEYSQLLESEPACRPTPCDPQRLLRSAVAPFGRIAADKGLRLVVDAEPGEVLLDGELARRALVQLIDNAVRFTPRGEVLVAFRRSRSGQPQLEVWDTGLGIAPERLAGLLVREARPESGPRGVLTGAGLGLAIARRLAEGLGGRLRVRSEPGLGTRAVLTLPGGEHTATDDRADGTLLVIEPDLDRRRRLERFLALGDWHVLSASDFERADEARRDDPGATPAFVLVADEAQAVALAARAGWHAVPVLHAATLQDAGHSQGNSPSPAVLRRQVRALARTTATTATTAVPAAGHVLPVRTQPRILLVEDNPTNQEVTRRFLEAFGCVVELAEDGADAVARFAPGRYDAILMDVQMPLMDGLEATRALRRVEGDGARTPIIALTANAMSGDRERCLSAGMDDYLSKPIEPGRLEVVLGRALVRP